MHFIEIKYMSCLQNETTVDLESAGHVSVMVLLNFCFIILKTLDFGKKSADG